MKRFECEGCGECCKELGKGNYLPLFEWEAEEYKELAKEKGLTLNIKPINVYLDKRSKIVFCIQYGLFDMPCLFLENNKCSIYDKRALICKQFPVINVPQFVEREIDPSCFLKCKHFDNKKFFVESFPTGKEYRRKEIEDYFKNTYGICYDYALQSSSLTDFILHSLEDYVKAGKIKLRKISEFDLYKYKVIPYFEFLIHKGFMDNKAKEFLIQSFKDKELFKKNFIDKND